MSESTKAEYKEAQDYERSAFVVPLEQYLSVEKELYEVQEKYDTLAVDYMLDVNKICNQRDEAIKQLKEAWFAMDEIEGTDRINEWQNKNAHFLDTNI